MLVDTHTHLFTEEFDADRSDVIGRAMQSGVHRMYLPNIDSSSIDRMLKLEADFPSLCFAMMGLHPGSVNDRFEEELKVVEDWLSRRPFKAVGEIGMDLYWDKTWVAQQEEALKRQIVLAKKYALPIVLHQRECFEELFRIVASFQDGSLRGIFHCFTGSLDQARRIIDLGGFKLGIGGTLTYKNSNLPEVLRSVELEHLVLETDSPYLPPVPYRGKRNESSYINFVAQKLAEIKSIPVQRIAEITSANALSIFGS